MYNGKISRVIYDFSSNAKITESIRHNFDKATLTRLKKIERQKEVYDQIFKVT